MVCWRNQDRKPSKRTAGCHRGYCPLTWQKTNKQSAGQWTSTKSKNIRYPYHLYERISTSIFQLNIDERERERERQRESCVWKWSVFQDDFSKIFQEPCSFDFPMVIRHNSNIPWKSQGSSSDSHGHPGKPRPFFLQALRGLRGESSEGATGRRWGDKIGAFLSHGGTP